MANYMLKYLRMDEVDTLLAVCKRMKIGAA